MAVCEGGPRARRAPTPPPSQGALSLGGGDDRPFTLAPVRPWRSQGLEGVWRGTYGPHRLEVVRLGAAESAVAAAGASHPAPSPLPPPLPSCLDAVKLLGDAHVPAGRASFRVDPAAPSTPAHDLLSLGPRPAGARLRLPPGWRADVLDLGAAALVVRGAWPATAVVAAPGFADPTTVPAQVALLEPGDVLAVAWGGGMRSISLFARVEDREFRGGRGGG